MTPFALTPRVYMASAGTGKTFQLTIRAVTLMMRRVAPESILATTFTRKAAGEIMERVLLQLVKAAEKEDCLAELGGHVDDRSLTTELCVELLGDCLRNVHRFSVQTLDAFLGKIAKLHSLEVGLPLGWRIADARDLSRLSQNAMADVLDEAGEDEILALLRRLQGEDPRRSAYGALERVVADSYSIYRQSKPEAWDALTPLPPLGAEELVKRIAELQMAPLPVTGKGKPDKRWLSAREKAVATADARHWEGFLESGLVKKICADDYIYCKHPIDGVVLESLEALVGHARSEIVDTIRARGLAQRDFLARYDQAFSARKAAEGLFEFDDIPHALIRDAAGGSEHEPLGPRFDVGIEHLLLDEFQDTSVMQGQVLDPLIKSVLSEGVEESSFFCVGDAKQSIYGWRQGEPRLLQSLPERYPAIDSKPLEGNRRSSKVVLESVKQVFENIDACSAFADSRPMRAAAVAFKESFESPIAIKEKLPGRVALIEVESHEKRIDGRRKDVLGYAVSHVARLVEEAPLAKIGVLVRRKAAMPAIIYGLMQRGIPTSGEGGNPLTDSDAVRISLSLLTLAEHPEDTAAFFHVATSAFAPWFSLSFDVKAASPRAEALSAEVRRRLAAEGFGKFFTWLQGHVLLEATFGAWDRVRFGQLVDMAFELEEMATDGGPGAFADRVWAESVEAPTEATVKVMTIHGSKGLEFDAVVLPDLEGAIGGRLPALLTRRTDPWSSMDMVAPSSKWSDAHPELEQLVAEGKARALREELCVLYVAMTRAARRLDLLIASEGEASSLTSVLRETLLADPAPPEGGENEEVAAESEPFVDGVRESWRHPLSVDTWYEASADGAALTLEAATEHEESPTVVGSREIQFAVQNEPRWLPKSSPSGRSEQSEITPSSLLDLSAGSARLRGLVMHAWLAEMEWLEDYSPADDLLHSQARRVACEEKQDLSRRVVTQMIEEYRAMLRQPRVLAELSRPKSRHGVEVWRERPFAVSLDLEGVQTMVRGAFDRVVLRYEDDRLVAADVLDYKTDSLSTPSARGAGRQLDLIPGAAEESGGESLLLAKTEHYRPQMESYRDVLAALTGLEPDAIQTRLLFLSSDKLVNI